MTCLQSHASLNARLQGIEYSCNDVWLQQYRNIQYGRIPARFASPEPPSIISTEKNCYSTLDCTEFGPRCPQIHVDIGHLLRIPEKVSIINEAEDEFACLNLHITLPKETSTRESGKLLPVLIWIYGGSQVMTFGSAVSGCCDPSTIVADAQQARQPLIFVGINYRLNIFAFGGGAKNLALQDQSLAIEWVKSHIGGFGGDAENITLAGESAGAVYTHAQLFGDASKHIRRAILQSGSLHLSPPLPIARGEAVIAKLTDEVLRLSGKSLCGAPASVLVQALESSGIKSLWLQENESLVGWQDVQENVAELMIGDVEYESVIWRNGIELMTAENIVECFDKHLKPKDAQLLRQLYCIVPGRPTSCKLGALDFINDARFALPVEDIVQRWRSVGHPVYRYVVDQVNPWQASHRSHHAVDLLLLFGGYDLSFNPSVEAVGAEMRRRWILFVNGQAPWKSEKTFAFGPLGKSGEITHEELATRRRIRHIEVLRSIEPAEVQGLFGALAAGRISLEN